MTWLLALLLATAEPDPRVPLVEARLAADHRLALAQARVLEETSPEAARAYGVSYFRGRVLESLGLETEAQEAFQAAMAEAPELRPYARYWISRGVIDEHPEIVAGFILGAIHPETPNVLREPATELLARAILAGGDCAVLGRTRLDRLPEEEQRLLQVVSAECARRAGRPLQAVAILQRLLAEERTDEPARQAAERLATLVDLLPNPRGEAQQSDRGELHRLLGLTFHHHREYDRSIPYLERALATLTRGKRVSSDEEWEARYALARGYFWREQFAVAAARFDDLAIRARNLDERSQALYQQARSLELASDWDAADAVFRRTYSTLPTSRYAGPALLSALRIEWRSNRRREALDLFSRLARQPGSGEYTARAALFFASSELVRGAVGRSAEWLATALAADPEVVIEVDYWRGRLAELEEAPERAVRQYLDVVLRDPYHPLAQAARERLALPELRVGVSAELARRSGSARAQDLYITWLLAGDRTVAGRAARRLLVDRYAATSGIGPLFRLQPVPVPDWPLWNRELDSAEEKLLALGMIREIAPRVADHFPPSEPSLAYTGSVLLADSLEVRRSILLAGSLERRLDRRVEPPLVPEELRRLLYPFPWRELVEREAARFESDPLLLVAIMREESRFEPQALSPVSARGLTQFVWLTARRLAAQIGLGQIRPEDLYRPEVAIRLGAAYVAELTTDFRGNRHAAVAAYNAGPAQARLWQSYCYSRELPEYYSKTGFSETRNYLRKVLSSRAHYSELYSPRPPA